MSNESRPAQGPALLLSRAKVADQAIVDASDAKGWGIRIGRWENKVRAFEAEWDWGESERLLALFDEGEAAVDPSIVLHPEWRARLQGRIDAGLKWLSEHDVSIESIGLHTE